MRHVPGLGDGCRCECSSIYNFARVPGRSQEQDQEGSSEGEEEEEPIQFQVRMVMETPVTSVAAAGEAHGRR